MRVPSNISMLVTCVVVLTLGYFIFPLKHPPSAYFAGGAIVLLFAFISSTFVLKSDYNKVVAAENNAERREQLEKDAQIGARLLKALNADSREAALQEIRRLKSVESKAAKRDNRPEPPPAVKTETDTGPLYERIQRLSSELTSQQRLLADKSCENEKLTGALAEAAKAGRREEYFRNQAEALLLREKELQEQLTAAAVKQTTASAEHEQRLHTERVHAAQLERDNTELRARVEELRGDQAALLERLTTINSAHSVMRARAQGYLRRLREARGENRKLRRTIGSLRGDVARQTERILQSEQNGIRMEQALQNEISLLREAQQTLEDENACLSAQNVGLQESNRHLEQEFFAAASRIEQLQARNHSLIETARTADNLTRLRGGKKSVLPSRAEVTLREDSKVRPCEELRSRIGRYRGLLRSRRAQARQRLSSLRSLELEVAHHRAIFEELERQFPAEVEKAVQSVTA